MKHLDENEIAQAAEWLAGKTAELPDDIQNPLEKCMVCKMEILEEGEIIKPD